MFVAMEKSYTGTIYVTIKNVLTLREKPELLLL